MAINQLVLCRGGAAASSFTHVVVLVFLIIMVGAEGRRYCAFDSVFVGGEGKRIIELRSLLASAYKLSG